MKAAVAKALVLVIVVGPVFYPTPAYSASGHKCSNQACDLSAIGRRRFFKTASPGNWYSTEKEKELGDKYSAAVDRRVDLLRDADISAYVDQVAKRVTQNSDADMPITVRIIRRDAPGAFTLYGGHLYLTTGLLLKLHSEGELASVLARGIAHTAMRSVATLQTRATLMEIASSPASILLFAIDSVPHVAANNDLAIQAFGSLQFQRDFEIKADYFGIQYVYKGGYDPDCFVSAVRSLWQLDPSGSLAKAFYPFPPLNERLKKLQQEIDDILPRQAGAVISNSEFDQFIERLRGIASPETKTGKDAQPKLIRHDLESE